MYRGAMIPGLLLASAYIAYVVIISFIRPGSAPALPEEARIYVKPDRSRGLRSLAVLTIIASTVSYFATQHYFSEHNQVPVDERVVISLKAWGITAPISALVNKALSPCLLPRLAEQGDGNGGVEGRRVLCSVKTGGR